MTYTAHSPNGPRIALAISEDLFRWQRLGLATFLPYEGIEFEGVDNKDASVSPVAISDPSGQLSMAILLKCDTEPLDSGRIAGLIEQDSRYADAGVIAAPDQSREKVELAIWTPRGGQVQDAFGFQRIAWLWFHQHAKTPQVEVTHHGACCWKSKPVWAAV